MLKNGARVSVGWETGKSPSTSLRAKDVSAAAGFDFLLRRFQNYFAPRHVRLFLKDFCGPRWVVFNICVQCKLENSSAADFEKEPRNCKYAALYLCFVAKIRAFLLYRYRGKDFILILIFSQFKKIIHLHIFPTRRNLTSNLIIR